MSYLILLLILAGIFFLAASGQMLLSQYLKLLTVCQGAFMMIGAYVTAYLALKGFPVVVVIGASIISSAVIGAFVLWLFSRCSNEHIVLATLVFQLIAIEIWLNLEITGGAFGIAGIPTNHEWSRETLVLIGLLVSICTLFLWNRTFRSSQLGVDAAIVGENSLLAESLGVSPTNTRVVIFTAAGALGGLSGSLFAYYFSFIEPFSFGISESVFILSIAIIANSKRLLSLFFVAVLLVFVPEAIKEIPNLQEYSANIRTLVYGIFLMTAVFITQRLGIRND